MCNWLVTLNTELSFEFFNYSARVLFAFGCTGKQENIDAAVLFCLFPCFLFSYSIYILTLADFADFLEAFKSWPNMAFSSIRLLAMLAAFILVANTSRCYNSALPKL
jgi:hypothetical protein